jgi:hypothetical protein
MGIFMIHILTKCHMLDSSGSLDMTVKSEANFKQHCLWAGLQDAETVCDDRILETVQLLLN